MNHPATLALVEKTNTRLNGRLPCGRKHGSTCVSYCTLFLLFLCDFLHFVFYTYTPGVRRIRTFFFFFSPDHVLSLTSGQHGLPSIPGGANVVRD